MIENVTAQGIGCLIFGLPDGRRLKCIRSKAGAAFGRRLRPGVSRSPPSVFIPRLPVRGPAAAGAEVDCVRGPGVTFIPKNFAATGPWF